MSYTASLGGDSAKAMTMLSRAAVVCALLIPSTWLQDKENAQRECQEHVEKWSCKICASVDVNCVLVPCGHCICEVRSLQDS